MLLSLEMLESTFVFTKFLLSRDSNDVKSELIFSLRTKNIMLRTLSWFGVNVVNCDDWL